MQSALNAGIAGQNRWYRSELLLSKGYEVQGVIRRASTFNTRRSDPIYRDSHAPEVRLCLHYCTDLQGDRQ